MVIMVMARMALVVAMVLPYNDDDDGDDDNDDGGDDDDDSALCLQGHVTVSDINASMLEEGRARAQKMNIPGAPLPLYPLTFLISLHLTVTTATSSAPWNSLLRLPDAPCALLTRTDG